MDKNREAILQARQRQIDHINKASHSSSDAEEDDIEKARAVGEMHSNGKWVWTEYKPGKFDWRTAKKGSKPAAPAKAVEAEPEVEAEEPVAKVEGLNAKELQTLYIKSIMHNEKQLNNKKMRDSGVISSVYPLRNLKFIAYVKENIYKGNTTFDRIKKYYNINAINQKDFTNKVLKNHTFDEVQKTINNESIKAGNVIANLFNKHIKELNNLLD